MAEKEIEKDTLLGSAPVSKLMVKFAVPSIIGMLVGALYNIVDQLFIGHGVGTNGNAATNIAFPFTTACMAVALLLGIGGASCFNLTMGRGNPKRAGYFAGNSITMLIISGVIISVITLIFLTPLLKFFGSPDDVLPYAKDYVFVSAFGFPFLILGTGGGHIIRADGSPRMTMICNLTGAIINTEEFSIISFDGIIKSFCSIGLINLLFSYSLRYIMVQVFILTSPFAFLSLISDSSSWVFKSWFRSFIALLLVQLLIAIILCLALSLGINNSNFSKLLFIGVIYALTRANSYMTQIFGGISTDISSGISSIKNLKF